MRGRLLPVLLLLAGALGALTGCDSGPATTATAVTTAPTAPPGTGAAAGWVPSDPALADVCRSRLPPQAAATLALIAAGGPYPYRADGTEFQNREHRLPRQRGGYYREYTVVTPGSADRGERRVITGSAGERYWTADHYGSFQEIDVRC
ncbi:ribonuclease domain-containing protein [Kitasatospora sp. NPDC094015]|uniref:ribonuclease domain-containing protein n=1 Tax=Kitasatospora sp. NPDC094015 TaxID=3155205 RepID=UPI003320EF62